MPLLRVLCCAVQVRDHPLVHKLEVDKPITEPQDEWKKALYRSQWPGLAKGPVDAAADTGSAADS